MLQRVHLIIHGRVQGVCFRALARQEAQSLGLTGWAKNTFDGSVEIVAEGTKEVLEKFVQWAHQGPPSAEVDRVESAWEPAQKGFTRFEIKHSS